MLTEQQIKKLVLQEFMNLCAEENPGDNFNSYVTRDHGGQVEDPKSQLMRKLQYLIGSELMPATPKKAEPIEA